MNAKDIEIIKCAAFHESGHILMAYLMEWSVKEVKIVLNDEDLFENGVTKYDYAEEQSFINLVSNYRNEIPYFNSLNETQKENCFDVAEKRLYTVMGGPISEKGYLIGNNTRSWVIDRTDIRKCDDRIYFTFEEFLKENNPNFDINFFDNNTKKFAKWMSKEEVWHFINTLAHELISARNYVMTNIQVEDVLTRNGYFDYLDKLRNRHNIQN